MGEKVQVLDKGKVKYMGETWKVKSNTTVATIMKKTVKGGNLEIDRRRVVGDPYKLKAKYLDDDYEVLYAHNWKDIVQEKHNATDVEAKKRKETTVQTEDFFGEGESIVDDMPEEDENSSAVSLKPSLAKSIAEKMGVSTKVILGMAILLGVGGLLIFLKAIKVI